MLGARSLQTVTCSLMLLAAYTSAAFSGQARTYPAGPVKFVTQAAPGGGNDPQMRLVAEQLGKLWGQETLVLNQPGAGGLVAARTAASAAPDGHTLFMAIASTFVVLPETQPSLPFDVNNFVPIGFIGEVPMMIAASPTLAVSSLPELLAYSKAQSGGISVAVGSRGGLPHLVAELFSIRSGINLTPIFYPGGSPKAMSDLISGRVAIGVEGMAGPIAAQLKILAVASPQRLISHPSLPTVSETVPGFAASGWFVMVAPSGTPEPIVNRINEDLRLVLARPEVRQKFDALNVSTRTMLPRELAEFIRSERQLWKPVVNQLLVPK